MLKKVLITGGTGFIGNYLCREFQAFGYDVRILSRNVKTSEKKNEIEVIAWDGKSKEGWYEHAENAFVIINLAGENIGSGFWTAKKKQAIITSRVLAGNAVVDAVKHLNEKPDVIIQPSGIGYYGNRGNEMLDEASSMGSGFLPHVAQEWENAIEEVKNYGVRLVILRIGVVLGKHGGFLSRVALPYKFFLGGHFGNGKQFIAWIHIDDLVGAIQFILQNKKITGVINLTSPNPVCAKDFFKTIGKIMKRPSYMSIPSSVIRAFMGDMGKELILSSQRAIPKRLLEYGYNFSYPELKPALKNLLSH